MNEQEYTAAASELELFQRGRDTAADRLRRAKDGCDAAAGQDMAIQADATVELENAIAVASEWGLISQKLGA